MGCSASTSGFSVDHNKELNAYLSDEEIILVKESWRVLQDDLESLGLATFHRLFMHNRHLRKLFQNLQTQENSGEHVVDEEKLIEHGKIVMQAFGAAVECLDDSSHLSNLLVSVGERHALIGIDAATIRLLWPAIVATLEERLGHDFTPQLGQAWEHVFQYICGKLVEGIGKWTCDNGNT